MIGQLNTEGASMGSSPISGSNGAFKSNPSFVKEAFACRIVCEFVFEEKIWTVIHASYLLFLD